MVQAMAKHMRYLLILNLIMSVACTSVETSSQEDEMVEEIMEFLDGDTDPNLSETTIN